jgi:uracil-DNA glycosylase family 4
MTSTAPFTAGPLNARICFVGEAPGEDEARLGGAFVGRAGHELKKLCASTGINIEQCRLENVLQFHPPSNDMKPFFRFSGRNVKTSPEYDSAVAALKERLQELPAHVFVPLGNSALYALTGQVGITKYRGSILESTLLPGRKCVPTIHPAAALYGQRAADKSLFGGGDLSYHYFIAFDLKRVREESLSPALQIPDRDLIVNASFEEIRSYLEEILLRDQVAYDIETSANHLSHIAFALSPVSALCIPFFESGRDLWSPTQEATLLLLIAKILEDPRITKIGQNLSFDASFMNYHFDIVVSPLEDTMVASAILYPDFPKGLDFLTSLYCRGTPYYKDDGKNFFRGASGDTQMFRRYNAMDAAVLMDIFPAQQKELERSGNLSTYQAQMKTLQPLVFMGNRGIAVNTDRLSEASETTQDEIAEVEAELRQLMGAEINLNSTKQLMRYFYVEKGLRPYTKKRKDGNSTNTLDDKALQRIANKGQKGSAEAKLLIRYRGLAKRFSTYYSIELDPDGRFRASFNPVGTVQGRPSSSKTLRGTGSNFLNLPPEYRALFTADPGYLFIVQDLAQAENRIVAYEAQEAKMMQALEAGEDIHSATGCLLHGISLDQITPEIRSDGKVANHGLNYGLGINQFCLQYQLELEKGRWLWETYHAVYPGVHGWHSSLREELKNNRMTLTNCFGRRRKFIDPWGDKLFQKAYNFRPQSIVAFITAQWGFCPIYYWQDLYADVILANTVYDSIWYLVPKTDLVRAVEIIRSIKTLLERTLTIHGRSFYIPVDTKIGFNIDEDAMLSWKAAKINSMSSDDLATELERYVNEN